MAREHKVEVYMPLYVGDYDRDTSDLSFEEHGFYGAILRALWVRDGVLTTEPERLSRILRTDVATLGRLWPSVERFLDVSEDGRTFTQGRLASELEKAIAKRVAAAESGRRGGEKARNSHAGSDPTSDPTSEKVATLSDSVQLTAKLNSTSSESESPSGSVSVSESPVLSLFASGRAIPLPPSTGREPEFPESFLEVWAATGKHGKKLKAMEAWRKVGRPTWASISGTYAAYLRSERPVAGCVMDLSTWLNGRCHQQEWLPVAPLARANGPPQDVRVGHVRADGFKHGGGADHGF